MTVKDVKKYMKDNNLTQVLVIPTQNIEITTQINDLMSKRKYQILEAYEEKDKKYRSMCKLAENLRLTQNEFKFYFTANQPCIVFYNEDDNNSIVMMHKMISSNICTDEDCLKLDEIMCEA